MDVNVVNADEKQGKGSTILATLVVLGAAAATFVVVRRLIRGEKLMDTDALLAACDRAADNLDAILSAERSPAAS